MQPPPSASPNKCINRNRVGCEAKGLKMNATGRVQGTINRAAILAALVSIAHAIAGLHLDSLNTYEGVAVAAVSIVLAGMTGYGGKLAVWASEVRDAAAQIGERDDG